MIDLWREWVKEVAILNAPAEHAGIQQIYSDLSWSVSGRRFRGGMTLADSGYSQAKLTQLTNHYYHYVAVQRAVDDLKARVDARKYGSGAFDFRGLPKKNTKQDFCMQAGVVTIYPSSNRSEFTIFYRTVELIKRFRGDIVWLDTFILPHFDFVFQVYPLARINFKFTNATWHPMYSVFCHSIRKSVFRSIYRIASWIW